MRCMLDTNVLVSAALFPRGITAAAYMKAVAPPHKGVVCDYVVDELRRVFNEKFPLRIRDYERFVSIMASTVEIVLTPPDKERVEDEKRVRDTNDRPILRAAIAAKVDILITGDKDFLESGIVIPKILSSAEFMRLP